MRVDVVVWGEQGGGKRRVGGVRLSIELGSGADQGGK
jgi:hypothetical protein